MSNAIKVRDNERFYKSPMVTRDPDDPRNARTHSGKSIEGNRLVYYRKKVAVYPDVQSATAAVKRILKTRRKS